MKLSEAGREFLIRMEGGIKRHAYRAVDWNHRMLIGIGHELSVVERVDGVIHLGNQFIPWIQGLTHDEAEELLDQDLQPVERQVNEIPGLNQSQYDALVSFCFSIGINKFRNSTVKRHLIQGHSDPVPGLMKSWTHDDGMLIYDLIRRRQCEVALLTTGDYGQRSDWIEVGPADDVTHPPVG